MTLVTRLQAHIQEFSLLQPGDRLLVGVSGGPDSVALLRLLHTLRHEWGLQLHIAHYNHRWRSDSDEDEQFVADLATSCGTPYTVGRSRSTRGATGTGSAEEKARLARLRFFKKVLRQTDFNAIVLAHTKDDLAETVLMRIIRGTGLQGLRAMQPCTTIDGMKIIRPLLNFTKTELATYLKKTGGHFRVDPTNEQEQYFRNKVRRRLLPLLRQEYNAGIDNALVHLAKTLQADFDFIDAEAEKLLQRHCRMDRSRQTVVMPIKPFATQSAALQRVVLRKIYAFLQGHTRKIGFQHIQAVVKILDRPRTSPATNWPGGIRIRRGRESLSFSRSINT